MPHKKPKTLTVAALAGLLFAANHVNAQVRQPAPTGQVPKAYSGVQSTPAATYKPRPTGQIAPEAPGQLGTIVQPAPTPVPSQKVSSDVQDLGFEVNSRPSTQQGMVPKVTTSQDPRTMRERYQPELIIQQQPASAGGSVQQPVQQMQQAPAGGNYAPATQVAPAQTGATTTPVQAAPQPGQAATQSPAPQATQSAAPKASPQRVAPN
ncbi:hypothetical protein [Dyadobacter sp. 676]|uniref:Uncharacterized protein n=1 Tax=Dyadobacter sp. 676 TaxID=3088362 RepID=A0AAU8FJM2_9BACT